MKKGLLLALVLLVACAVRFPRLGADPPIDAEGTNAVSLDAFWYLEGASSRADGVELEPSRAYDLHPWIEAGRAWFAVFGSGLEPACALGAAIGVATVLAAFFLARPLGEKAAFATASLLAVAYPFVQQGRTPLIYGPVAFLMTLAGALYVRDTRWSRGAAWALALAAPILLKAHAAALLGGLVLAALARAERRSRTLLLLGGGAAALALLLWLVDPLSVVALNRARVASYANTLDGGALVERALRLGSRQEALRSTDVQAIGSGLAVLSPALFLLAAIGAGLALVDSTRLEGRARTALAVAFGWAGAFLVAAVPIDYRPMRYNIPVFPAAAVLASFAAVRLLDGPAGKRAEPGRAGRALVVAGLALVGALFGSHALDLLAALVRREPTLEALAAAAFASSLAVVAAWIARLAPPRPVTRIVAVSLLALSTADLARDVRALERATWTLARARSVATRIVGQKAVLAGPYASALAAGTRLERRRSGWIPDGATPDELARGFRERGYTHFVVDVEQEWRSSLERRLAAAGSAPLLEAVLYVRAEPVFVYRLPWAKEPSYRETPYERARALDATSGIASGTRALDESGLSGDRDLVFARVRALFHDAKGPDALAAARDGVARLPEDADLAKLALDLEHLLPGDAAAPIGSRAR